MLSQEQTKWLGETWILGAIPLAISAIYVVLGGRSTEQWRRWVCCLPGLVLCGALGYAIAVSPLTEDQPWEPYYWPFLWMFLVYMASVVTCVIVHRGPKPVHALQVVQLVFAFLVWLFGAQIISRVPFP
jgi:hypothetical protein